MSEYKYFYKYDFIYEHALVISGLVVAEEIEIEGQATFSYEPGTPERGPTWNCGGEPAEGPEIENTSIDVFGHRPGNKDPAYRGEYTPLILASDLAQKIAEWLLEHRFDDLCDVAEGYKSDADYLRDHRL